MTRASSRSEIPFQMRHQGSRPASTIRPHSNAKSWYTNAESCRALAETWDEEDVWRRRGTRRVA